MNSIKVLLVFALFPRLDFTVNYKVITIDLFTAVIFIVKVSHMIMYLYYEHKINIKFKLF